MTDSVSNSDELELGEDPAATAEGVEGEEVGADEAAGADAAGDARGAGAPGAEATDLDDLAEEVEGALDTELVALREEFESLNDRHLRLAAEFNNYRRRVEQERLDLWGRAQAELVGRLLDVLDDLQRVAGLDLSSATVEGIMEGIDLVDRKFVRALADAGVEVLNPAGERFDPEVMEAVLMVPAEDEAEDDTVMQVFQKGYTLKGRLVRPARVSVRRHG